jgi:hypothetical protein
MSKPRTRRALPNQRSARLARRAKLDKWAIRGRLPDRQSLRGRVWSICGGRPTCGIDLGQILFAMHERPRPRTKAYRRHNGLSGIETGFIRTIGEIVDIAVGVPVLVGLGPEHLAKGKTGLSSRKTSLRVRLAAKPPGFC